VLRGLLKEVDEFLATSIGETSAVVMPDFFLDRLVSLSWNAETLCKNLNNVAKRKGGSIDGLKQTEMRGGNAANTASALAALGARATPIICTDKLGSQFIKFALRSSRIDLSHVKSFDKPSITTALEFETGDGRANVMLRDVGSLADFGPGDLNSSDFDAIERADYVCVFNWAGTRRFGTELARTVFHHVRKRGKTYYDTADPIPNRAKIPELMKILESRDLDVLSVNENEAICYASQIDGEVKKLRKRGQSEELAKESARILASRLAARVDLHAAAFSATFTKKNETIVPTFDVPVLRATGAGDAWNAGNVIGDARGLPDDCRLALANSVAAYYISNPFGSHPSRKQLRAFFKKARLKPRQ
jgi:ribokinase